MSWIMELVLGICLVAATLGVAFKSKKHRLFGLLVLIGIAFAIWNYAPDRISQAPKVIVQTSTGGEDLSHLLENQQRLMETVQRLEAAVADLDSSRTRQKLGWVLEIALGICMITVVGGFVNYLNQRSKRLGKTLKSDKQTDKRLDALEQRLTDLQDVMINIDDKMDRLGSPREPA